MVRFNSETSPGTDEKRRRILDAAMAVCEERGVYAARMEEVAALAQVSKGTLYRFFESKEDLFLATLIASYEEGLTFVAPALGDDPSMRVVLEAVLDGLCKVLATVGPRARVHYQVWGVVADHPEFAARLNEFLRTFHRERHQEFLELVLEGQRRGEFRTDVNAETVVAGMGALLSGLIYRGAFDPDAATPEGLRACFQTMVLDVLIDSPTARPTEVDGDGD